MTGVLSPHFQLLLVFVRPTRPTNILVLSLLFTEHRLSLPSHAGNAFLIRFIFCQWLFGVVTRKKMRCGESTFVRIFCSILRRPSYLASKITQAIVTMFMKPSAFACVVKFLPLNKNQPEETDKVCRQINSQKGTL